MDGTPVLTKFYGNKNEVLSGEITMEINYKELVRQLKACVFTVIYPELAGNAATAIQLLSERLAKYEDLEKQGRLVTLPCKIGDTVYRVCKKKYDVDGYGMQWEEDWGIVTNTFHLGMFYEIGKNVFLTREEAEEVLKSK